MSNRSAYISSLKISDYSLLLKVENNYQSQIYVTTFQRIKEELDDSKINLIRVQFDIEYLEQIEILFYLAMVLNKNKSTKRRIEIILSKISLTKDQHHILHLLFSNMFINRLIDIYHKNITFKIQLGEKNFNNVDKAAQYASYFLNLKFEYIFFDIAKFETRKDLTKFTKEFQNNLLLKICSELYEDDGNLAKGPKELLHKSINDSIEKITFESKENILGVFAKFRLNFPVDHFPRIEFSPSNFPCFVEIFSFDGFGASSKKIQTIRLKPTREKKVIVNIGATFRDQKWDQYWGDIQHELRETQASIIDVLLDECTWADPTPLLSLCVAIAECRLKGKSINIFLPDMDRIENKKRAFIGYLGKENFIDAFMAFESEKNCKTTFFDGRNLVTNINEFKDNLLRFAQYTKFKNATCITAKLFNFQKNDNVNEIVENLITEAKTNNLEKHFLGSPESFDFSKRQDPIHIKQELRQILTELIRNIVDHAYDKKLLEKTGNAKLGAVYIRIRYGLEDGRSVISRGDLQKLYVDEVKFCPRLKYSEPVKKLGFIEVFVVDTGKGIATDFINDGKQNKDQHDLGALHSFFIRMASGKPYSKFSRSKRKVLLRSPMPGLNYISKMLAGRQSFMRLLYKSEWSGSTFPLPIKYDERNDEQIWGNLSSQTQGNFIYSKRHVRGTFALIRISCGAPIGLPSNWNALSLIKRDSNNDFIVEAYKSLNDKSYEWPGIYFVVYDDLIDKFFRLNRNRLEVKIGNKKCIDKILVWRPVNSLRRDEIIFKIKEIAEEGMSHLIIIDQDFASAIMTNWSIIGTSSKSYGNLDRITIISNNYCCVESISRSGKFQNNSSTKLLDKNNGVHIGHIVSLLKELDTTLFKIAIDSEQNTNTTITDEKIKWFGSKDTEYYIENYINFVQTLNLKVFRWIYRRSMGRILSFISSSRRPISIDHIVEPLIDNFFYQNNSLYYNDCDEESDNIRALIGSVVASGDTASSIENEYRFQHYSPKIININFMPNHDSNLHHDSRSEFLYLLNWPYVEPDTPVALFQEDKDEKSPSYERIVDSPSVGRYGNKTWKMVRDYLDKKEKVKGKKQKSFYGCSPDRPEGYKTSEIYTYWQSRNLLRFGHWVNYKYHDSVGLNLITAIRKDILTMDGMISKYLLSHFNRLNPDYEDIEGYIKCDFLVCIANEETLLIIDKLKEYFGSWLETKIVLLQLVQRRRKSVALRVNPLDIDRLRLLISKQRKKRETARLLLFNTQFSSVRTFIELCNLLNSLGATKVNSIALLDRTRNPNSSKIMKRNDYFKEHSRLWRLDIDSFSPSDGYNISAGCPLCECLTNIQIKLKEVFGDSILDRLRNWEECVKIKKLSHATPAEGLQSVNLPVKKDIKYGIKKYKNPGYDFFDKLELTQSTALTSVLIEIITISGRYDLITKYLSSIEKDKTDSNISDISKIKIEMIISQILYFRSDIGYKRRIMLYSELLISLFECPKENTSTAYAGLIFLSVNTALARGLVPLVSFLMKNKKQQSNLDFHIVASELITKAGVEYIKNLPDIKNKNKLLSIAIITNPLSDVESNYYFELFSIIGLRPGNTHSTKLRDILVSPSSCQHQNINLLISLLERLEYVFDELTKKSFTLAHKTKIEEIEEAHRLIAIHIDELSLLQDEFDEEVSKGLYKKILNYIYGGSTNTGLASFVKENFTRDFNQLPSYIKDILKKVDFNEEEFQEIYKKIDLSKFKRINDSAFNDKIRFVTTRQIETCIHEYIRNAYQYLIRYEKLENEKILFKFSPNKPNGQVNGINIIIMNRSLKQKQDSNSDEKSSISTINKLFLENFGGKVLINNTSIPDIYCVEVFLPLVSEVQLKKGEKNEISGTCH